MSYMSNDDQEKPLAPATKPNLTPITVDEAISIELKDHHKRFHNRTICFGIITAIILIISVVMLVLGFTVLHVKQPKLNMNSVTILQLDRVNLTDPTKTNLTLLVDVSIKNPNVAAFKFEPFNASLVYYDKVVGVADVPQGVVKARRTMWLNVTFEVVMAEMAGNQRFAGDLMVGMLPVETYVKIHGRVKILSIVKREVMVSVKCSVVVNVTSWEIVNQGCKKHVSS